MLSAGIELPPLETRFRDRHALVVARGPGYKSDLRMVRPYVREFRPVLVAVDGGADALREVGLRADVIVGDFDSVSDAALLAGRGARRPRLPGRERAGRASGCAGSGCGSTRVSAPGISEDLALQLAHERGARLIVAVGTHFNLVEFLERDREGMASTFVTRLKVGESLVDAKGVSRLVSRRVGVWPLAVFGATGIAAIVVAVLASPGAAQRARVDHARDRQRARALTPCTAATARTGPRLSACSTCATTSPRSRPSSWRSCSGIFVGVGLSGRGFVSDAERENLQSRIAELQRRARRRGRSRPGGRSPRRRRWTTTRVPRIPTSSAPGSTGARSASSSSARSTRGWPRRCAERSTTQAGASGRLRALRVPLDDEAIDAALGADPETRDLAGPDNREQLGRALARELVTAGPDPVLDRVAAELVEEQSAPATPAVDAVVVARPARPQGGETQTFLAGLYGGLAAAPLPAVGVDQADDAVSAVPAFRRSGLATVSGLDDATGQVALVYLLAGARSGSYGLGKTAVDGVLPAPAAVQPPVGE